MKYDSEPKPLLMQATPRLSEDKVKQCVDPKLNNDYPAKAIAKVLFYYYVFFLRYHLFFRLF